MKCLLTILLSSLLIIQNCVAPPVDQKKKPESEPEPPEVGENENLADVMEYHRYLQEVVKTLESDPDFRKKLETVNESDIRNGNIAHELEYVSHNVRSKLDELKRQELERLRHLATKEFELENGLDPRHMKIPEHLDHVNPHSFEIDDLKKLIAKTTKDLDEADQKRREEFKEYEMHKKFDQEEKMKNMTEEDKKKYETELHDLEKKHKDHEPLHHPGSKKQLEEVWEKQDHMESQDFDPKTFFYLHDLDGNGVWDPTEVKALFRKELDKLYNEGAPEDDLIERAEEMERMREHVMKEADLNKDGLISYDEFLAESKKAEFEQDPGWDPLDEQKIYSEQEYEEYRRQKAQEIERHIAQGMSQEHHAGQPQAAQQQFPPHPNQIHQDYMQNQGQFQQQVPQQQYYPQQGQYGNQMPQQVQYNQQPPQPGQYPNQVQQQPYQQQQYHPNQQIPVQNTNQLPQQQNYPPSNQQAPPQQFQQPPNMNQVPQQQYQQPINTNQIPQQQYQQPINTNQIPQQQYQQPINTNQIPQQQYQQPINTNQIPQQQYQQQPNANQVPQQVSQQVPQQGSQQVPQQVSQQVPQQGSQQVPQQVPQQGQNQPPVANNLNQALPAPQQNQPAAGQNQQNTQNQIPQQAHEQQAPNANAQAH